MIEEIIWKSYGNGLLMDYIWLMDYYIIIINYGNGNNIWKS